MIYLDNCSTTKPRREVINAMMESMEANFGNPSSLHRLGIRAEKKIKEARDAISSYLNVDSKEIYFTSGGTESNNIAIQSIVSKYNKRGNHIITTKIEHPSVLNVMKNYESLGYRVTYLDVDEYGFISLEQLKDSISKDTILISIIHVNNEIGSIQNIKEIRKMINDCNSQAILHLDGVQSFGKIEFSLKALGVDTYSFSGHKIHGPKGIGGLYINDNLKLSPIMFGGNQEKGLRSGTENLPGIIGFGEAVRIISKNFKYEQDHVNDLKKYMVKKIHDEIDDIRVNTTIELNSSPYILNVSFRNTRGEVLLHYLEDKNIYVSTSSACSSKGTEKSHVLKSIGLKDNEIEGAIRFCFSYENKKEDIDYTIEILKSSVKEIRKIIMR